MRNLMFYGMLALSSCLFSFSQTTAEKSLADELVGVYTGMFAKEGSLNREYKVKVTKVGDNVIQVVPFDGVSSKAFKAKIWEDNLSAIRVIRLDPIGDIVLKNGMMTPVNGRLSYGVSSVDGLRMEVFSGVKHLEIKHSIDK